MSHAVQIFVCTSESLDDFAKYLEQLLETPLQPINIEDRVIRVIYTGVTPNVYIQLHKHDLESGADFDLEHFPFQVSLRGSRKQGGNAAILLAREFGRSLFQ